MGVSWRKLDCYLEHKAYLDPALCTLDAFWRRPWSCKLLPTESLFIALLTLAGKFSQKEKNDPKL